jgi:adenine-specific DNA-methyltransferase
MNGDAAPSSPVDHWERGSIPTPAAVARWVAERVWHEWIAGQPVEPPRVLDPACGAGALLMALLETCPANLSAPLLHGVDRDAGVLTTARDLRAPGCEHLFACGDALTGPTFDDSPEALPGRTAQRKPPNSATDGATAPPLDWPATFPEIAARGGFDIVLANPPYVRERQAKSMFRELARTPLGEKYSEGRMDLWYYFLHRGLDLARPGGLLAYLVPSFWLGGTGAQKVRARLRDETSVVEVALFERWPIFPEVFGRHLLLLARKLPWTSERVRRLTPVGQPPRLRASKTDECWLPNTWREELIPTDTLFAEVHKKPEQSPVCVGAAFEVRQGIAENPPRITRPLAARYDGAWPIGTGVFLLSDEELDALDLTDTERTYIRPYYATRSVDRYHLPDEPTDWLLYVTRHNLSDLEACPNIKRHLSRFRPLLEQRREFRRGQLPWWAIHWPREERLFVAPRLLVPQMGARPRAVLVDRPAYVGFSTNVIVARPETPGGNDGLAALCGLINSRAAERWFDQHAKRRGVGYDIGGLTLRALPWSATDTDAIRHLAALVRERQTAASHDELESRIETIIETLFPVP